MIKNYFKIAYRNLINNKFFSIINLLGLTIGITISILIFIWVKHEVSYDKFHVNSKDIYRILTLSEGGTGYGSPPLLSPTIKDEIPAIVNSCRFIDMPTFQFKVDEFVDYETKGLCVDSSFFEIFSFELIKGDIKNIWDDPNNIVITKKFAKKYFGDKNPLGENIRIANSDFLKVTGVLENVPTNSHLQFDYLATYELMEQMRRAKPNWGDFNFRTYFQLNNNANKDSIINQINKIAINHECPQVVSKHLSFTIQELEKVYLNPGTSYHLPNLGSKSNVLIFSLIGILIIFIACFNYINLSTAKSEKRFKEAGLRKIVGANKHQLIIQFIGESLLLAIISLNFAILFAYRLMPLFNKLTGKTLELDFSDISFILFILIILITTGILAGLYPALYISRANPLNIIKGQLSNINSGRFKLPKGILRKILVIVQFSIATGLIICTLFVYKQLGHIRSESWSLKGDYIIHIPARENIGGKYELVKSRLKENTAIKNVSIKNSLPTVLSNNTAGVWWDGRRERTDVINMETQKIGYDYFETMGMEIVEGRSFSPEFPTDSSIGFILNEQALKLSQIKDPIGKTFGLYGQEGVIIGIVKNTLFKSAERDINAQLFHFLNNPAREAYFGSVLIRIDGKSIQNINLNSIIKYIEDIWNETNSNSPFEYHFLDETIEAQYKAENRMAKIFFYFAFFAIFISCLGMLGLSFYIIESRTKEIGIRKVNGASSWKINKLFLFDFIKSILFSTFISWPLSYFFIKNWLNNFAYKTNINITPFLLASIIAAIIAIITIIYIVNKAANQNPVKSLRYE
jgi:ABC-type antimicrobial peptide transport system permease subunit